jgi:hypothetical protein
MMSRVAEKMLCEAEGRKKAKRLRRDAVGVTLAPAATKVSDVAKVSGAIRASGSGFESSFVGTGWLH